MHLSFNVGLKLGGIRRAFVDRRTNAHSFFAYAADIANPSRYRIIKSEGPVISDNAGRGTKLMLSASVMNRFVTAVDVRGEGFALRAFTHADYVDARGRERSQTSTHVHLVMGSSANETGLTAHAKAAQNRWQRPATDAAVEVELFGSEAQAVRASSRAFAELMAQSLPGPLQLGYLSDARSAYLRHFPTYEAEWP